MTSVLGGAGGGSDGGSDGPSGSGGASGGESADGGPRSVESMLSDVV
jgi:hypothetical protein